MRWLVWWLRSVFCSHEWSREEHRYIVKNFGHTEREGQVISATCNHCGWHRSYWKFDP